MSDFNDTAIATGAIASFNNGADDVPVKSCVVTFTPSGGGGTPSAPVAISGVSGLSVTQLGKNLFDKDHANVANGYIDVSAFNTGNANAKTIYIPIKGSQTYTVSKTVGARFSIATSNVIPSSGATFTSRQAGNTSTSLTITAGANDTYLWAWVYLNGTDTGTLDDMLASVQIEVGSSATTYEPYQTPTQYTANLGRTIYGGQADIVNGKCEPINLIYPKYEGRTNEGITYTVNSDHSITCQGIATATSWAAANLTSMPEKMQLFPAGTYTISGGLSSDVLVYSGCIYTDGTTPYIPYDTGSGATITLEKPAYLYPQIRVGSGTDLTTPVTIYIQLEKGSTVHDYSPYFEPFTFTGVNVPTRLGYNAFWSDCGDTEVTYYKSGYGFTSVTVNQKDGNDELIATKTAKLHKVIYAGEVDVIKGTAKPKNLLKVTDGTYTIGNTGASATISNGSVVVTGTTTNSGGRTTRLSDYFILKAGTYMLSPVLSTSPYVRSYLNKKSDNTVVGYSSGNSFTVEEDVEVYFGINVESGYTYDATITPQLEIGTSITDYAPYFEPFTFTPISMETVEGLNVLYANEGDSTITYRKSTD